MRRQVLINTNEFTSREWEYLLSILHEIGHAVIYESDEEEQKIYDEFEILHHRRGYLKTNFAAMERLNSLHSGMERDAWAYAIRQLKKILEKLNMSTNTIFSSTYELREYIHELLVTYKEWGIRDIKNMDVPEEEREELLDYISKLYTRKDVVN